MITVENLIRNKRDFWNNMISDRSNFQSHFRRKRLFGETQILGRWRKLNRIFSRSLFICIYFFQF